MKIGIIHDAATFERMRAEWGELLDDSDAAVFNSWEWLHPWYKRFGTGRALRILTARDGNGKLIGLMPLCAQKRRAAGRKMRRLAFLGETHVDGDYLDVVARRGSREEVTLAFVRKLRETQKSGAGWDVLDLIDFDSESPTVQVLQDVFAGRSFTTQVRDCSVCPYEVFAPGETFDDFLRRTKRRSNYLRRRKWLEEQPGYRIEKVENPDSLQEPFSQFIRLHALRWEGEGGSEGIPGPDVEAYHRETLRLLAERKQIRLYVMRVGGEAVASVYAIIHGGKFIYYQSGRDPQWRDKSVGLVMVGETFKDSIEAGLKEYDFLRGEEVFKSEWTGKQRRTVAVRIHPKGGVGEWLDREEQASKAIRSFLKKALPDNLVDALRKRQRKGTRTSA